MWRSLAAWSLGLLLALSAGATELRGSFDPARLVERFALIGPARLGTDESGTVQVIFGEVETKDGSRIPYQALFMMCDGSTDACANVHMRHDWYAEKSDVWCAINSWNAMPDYNGRAWAGFSFDKVRLIREQVGFVGARAEPEWKFVQLWRKELLEFHDLTENLPSSCE